MDDHVIHHEDYNLIVSSETRNEEAKIGNVSNFIRVRYKFLNLHDKDSCWNIAVTYEMSELRKAVTLVHSLNL